MHHIHTGLEGVTVADTDPKERFVSFKVTPANDRVLCVYVPSVHNTKEQIIRGHFFEGLQNYLKNKSKLNNNKIILGDFNCSMNKMESNGGNRTQNLHRCGFNYAQSKFIVDNELEDLWRRENPNSSEFTCYDRSFGTRSKVERVYTDTKIANNNKINYIMVSFPDHYNTISLDRLP